MVTMKPWATITKSSFFRGLFPGQKVVSQTYGGVPPPRKSPRTSEAPSPPVRGFLIVGMLIKSGPDQHPPCCVPSSARTAEVRL